MTTRIWLDTVVLAALDDAKEVLERLIAEGKQLVIANTALDVRVFQENIDWFEDQLAEGKINIEIWNTPDEMVSKEFFWSSCNMTSKPSTDLYEAVENFPNKEAILDLADLLLVYGMPKGDWVMGPWAPPAPLSSEIAEALGISASSTRTEVLDAAMSKNRFDLFNIYNAGYCNGLALQHNCDEILNVDGSLTTVTEIE